MKTIHILISSVILLLLSSCSDIKEDIWLEEDGSGKTTYSIDMYKSIAMMSSFGNAFKSDSSSNSSKDVKEELFSNFSLDSYDTTMYFKDMVPDSIREKDPENVKLIENAVLQMNINKAKEQAQITFTLPFETLNKLTQALTSLSDYSKQENKDDPSGNMMPLEGMFGASENTKQRFSFNEKLFKRAVTLTKNKAEKKADDPFNMGAMLFGDAKYITTYHFPYQVKSVNSDNAVINGNTVTIEKPLDEANNPTKDEEFIVNFKKKKFLGIF